MADTIIVRRNCSTCDATEDSTTNEFANIVGASITLGEESPVLLHVCKNCRANVFDGLLALGAPVVAKAKKVGGKRQTSGEHKCEFCPRTFAKAQGLGRHKGSVHKDQVPLKITPSTRRKKESA